MNVSRSALSALACLAVVSSGCTIKKIPGTEIDDTSETRGVIDVMNKYRVAVEQRNSDAIMALADESFRDDGGTSGPEDDLEYSSLSTVLPARFKKVGDMKLDVNVRKIEFDEQGAARVTYTYTMSFKLPGLSTRTQTETDIKQMTMKRFASSWKITSGI